MKTSISRRFVLLHPPRQVRTLASIAILAASGILVCSEALAQAVRLPRVTLPTNMTAQPGARISSSIGGTASNPVLNIRQLDPAAILRWNTFDIGADATVNIDQPSSTATLLNKVDGGLIQNKTVIEGMLKANGQVYIYNPNGIIFGKTSQVNVNSLVATTLKIDDRRFLAGLLAPSTEPIFSADPAHGDANGNSVPGAVTVEGASDNQARITAASGGKILLVAPTVSNNGILSAPDGQVALAGGGKVFLASPSDVSMRGLLVEVSNSNITGGSSVTNDTLGKILVGRGNASLVGLAVNQMGTVSATTSVTLNGSIYLRARDGAGKSSSTEGAVATNGGELTLGENSLTTVAPTLDDSSTVSSTSAFNKSVIDLSGKTIHLQEGAAVEAKGGSISLVARANPSNATVSQDNGARIYLDAGSRIDASGTTSSLAMESNVIAVELRGSELADSPLQRNSALRGKTVMIDIRKGTPLANVSGYLALVEKNVGQLTAAGGSVTFSSDSDVIVNSGASIDVSGGQLNYRAGHVATSQLTSRRRRIDIGSASSAVVYDGVLPAVAGPRNFEAGYSQGGSAGAIYFNAPTLLLRGSLKGTATPGAKQRDVKAADYPLGGQLVIGLDQRVLSGELATFTKYNYLGHVDLGGTVTKDVATPAFADSWDRNNAGHLLLQSTLDLDNAALSSGGFNQINFYTRGDIAVSKPLDLLAGGEVRLAAQGAVKFDAGVKLPGGTIEGLSAAGQLAVAPGAELDVAGVWTNDRIGARRARDAKGNLTEAIVQAGGTIALQGQTVDIGAGSRLDVSGGAWQNSSRKISAGAGGSISIISTPTDSSLPESAALTLGDAIDFRGYGLTSGGTLKLTGRNVLLGETATNPLDLGFDADFFQHGGFAKYDINAQGNLTVSAGTTIHPRMDNWYASRDTSRSSSGLMKDSFAITNLPLAGSPRVRGATSISLAARSELVDGSGRLWIQPGASIVTDPGAAVSLKAGRQLTVDGSVIDKGGSISALLYQTQSASAYRPERSIWLGSQSLLDAGGSTDRIWTNSRGVSNNELLDGGNIQIGGIDGSGTIVSAPGYVVAERGAKFDVSGVAAPMALRSGARGSAVARSVASAGGTVDIRAAEGLLFEGSFAAAGGDTSVAGGSLSITLDRGTAGGLSGSPGTDRNLSVLRVRPNAGTAAEGIVPAGLQADQTIVGAEGTGYVLADTLMQGGFDRIALKSQDLLSFDAGGASLALNTRTALSIDAPLFKAQNLASGGLINLSSGYARVGNSDWSHQSAANANLPSAGDATLAVSADTIDLIGNSVLQGIGRTNFNATGDIRLVGQVNVNLNADPAATLPVIHARGAFSAAGALSFAASQIYPTTLSEFALNASGSGSRIEFHGNGGAASSPLSAAGTLLVAAENIVQDGVLRAPFGSIALSASDTLSYSARSQTSVAGYGRVPFGRVSNGRDWLYDFGNGNTVAINSTASNGVALPQKTITSTARSVSVEKGALIDLSGGGDLYAYEFTAGPGGSSDVLAKTSSTAAATVFAVMPGYNSRVAPIDFQYQQDGGLQVGNRIYLSSMPGLAAGFYTLLPAHYALLSGAFAVTAASGTRDMSAAGNYAKTDGSWVVAGYRGSSAASSDSRWSGFVVSSSEQVRTRSEFTEYSANTFPASSLRPIDGGHVVFDVTKSLMLDGVVRLGAASGGRNGIADISAPEIAIVSERSDPLPLESTVGAVKLAVGDLTTLGADSLLLGAVRSATSAGDLITVGAANVVVENNAAHTLSGPEIIITATDSAILKDGSAVAARGALSRTPQDLLIFNKSTPTAGADGALLRVSNGAAVATRRNYTAADGSVSAPAGAKGTLDVGENVTVAAGGSVMLDATRSTVIDSPLALGSGTALGLGASRIMLGDDAPSTAGVLRFDNNALLALNTLSSLALTSYSTIDVHGGVNLGSAAMQNLSFAAGGMRGMSGSNAPQAAFTAQTIRFDLAGTDTAAGSVAGSVSFNARDIEIGNGAFALHGFSAATLNASNEIRAVGVSGKLSGDADLTLRAGRITARGGKDATVTAGGRLTLTQGSAVVGDLPARELGGKLAFQGQTITSDATIVAIAGRVGLTSTATAADVANGLDISGGTIKVSGGTISAAGGSETFGSTVAYAPAGSITIDGGVGDVSLASAATLDVSAGGAAAGTISLKAIAGKATVNAALKGGSDAGQTQGSFVMDVDRLDPFVSFGALNAKLNSNGFTESRNFRVRNSNATSLLGDLTLAAGETMTANQVLVAADNGNITIGGTIDASGAKGGSIELYASEAAASGSSGKVSLLGTAVLDASTSLAASLVSTAAGSAGDGGRIVVGTSTSDGNQPGTSNGGASISVDHNARFKVAGSGTGQDGTILLRAPRLSGNDDVAISVTNNATLADATAIRDTNGYILRNAAVTVEGTKVYSSTGSVSIGTSIDTASNSSLLAAVATTGAAPTTGKMYKDSNDFLSATNKGNLQTRLGATIAYQAGVEVRAAGNITVNVNEGAAISAQNRGWNLNAWRFGGQPGELTLRAGGNLDITGSISDGFVKPSTKIGMPGWTLDPTGGSSWSYRLSGGTDLAAANPLATKASTGDTIGDVTIGFARTTGTANDQPVALVRTGSGRIDIAAGRDFTLGALNAETASALGATVYTAGRHAALADGVIVAPKKQTINTAFAAANTATTAEFAQGGGAISIAASRNVTGAATSQLINNWLFRRGRTKTDSSGATVFDISTFGSTGDTGTAWWSRYDYFNQGVATFGGGDVSVIASRGDISNLSVSVATNGEVGGSAPVDGSLVERGGGDLRISAGNDIRGGTYYVQKGEGSLRALGSVSTSDHLVSTSEGSVKLRPVLALGDANISVTANQDVEIETAFNPTLTRQSSANAAAVPSAGSFASSVHYGYFSTYGQDSGIALTALNGDVVLGNNSAALLAASGSSISTPLTTDYSDYKTASLFQLYPGSVNIAALGGDIIYKNGFTLAPQALGQFNLLAGGSVRSDFPAGSGGIVIMSDIDPSRLPGVYSPRPVSVKNDINLLTYSQATDGIEFHTSSGLHSADPEPVRIIALSGDISGEVTKPYTFILPKKAEILAGQDIKNFGFKIQELNANDVTRIEAGRDFIDSTSPVTQVAVTHQITGPGRVDIQTGRNFDLGNGHGLVTRGNLDNSYLPDQGASINLVAGAHADYANFFKQYVTIADLSAADQAGLVAYVRGLNPSLPENIDPATALQRFNALSATDKSAYLDPRKPILNEVFFTKVRLASQDENVNVAADLSRFDTLIASLYPTSSISGGDINVFGSQLKTERGGSINLFAAGGSVYAGLPQQPTWLSKLLKLTPKSASEFGISSIRGGAIQALVKDDFLVNQGRVFTLGGGDISLISQYGNIDAGKGAKTAVSAPPPIIKTDSKGNTVVDISASIAGSGIATLRTDPSVPASNVYPIAPRGIFDAGDAGVRSSGTVNIIAGTVLNASNIAATSGVSGTHTTDTSGLSSAISAPANTTQTKTDDISKTMETKSANAGGTLTVEVIGFGSDQQAVTQGGQNASTGSTHSSSDEANGDDDKKKPRKQP